ncbi:MAG TPA: DUF4245 family protein [Kineosporiaceae bacterium]|nr:DUF4245 family protein [Kineosporiaceae bacterium]
MTEPEPEVPRRRSLNTTPRDMLLSMAVIVGLVLVFLLLIPRPNKIPERTLDVPAAAAAGTAALGFRPAVPALPAGWTARTADVQRGTDELPTWHLTYTSPSGHYVGVQQTAKATAAWEARQVTDGTDQGSIAVGGKTWVIRSRTDRKITSWVLRETPVTTVVTGTAPESELAFFASAVVADEVGS